MLRARGRPPSGLATTGGADPWAWLPAGPVRCGACGLVFSHLLVAEAHRWYGRCLPPAQLAARGWRWDGFAWRFPAPPGPGHPDEGHG